MHLFKYEAAGNDFLIVANPGPAQMGPVLAARLADRRRGIGGDGVIEVLTGGSLPVMRLFNQDGTVAEMSGNGLRCLGHLLVTRLGFGPAEVAVMTAAGERRYRMLSGDAGEAIGSTSMGTPEGGFAPEGFAVVSVGNPHEIHFVTEELSDLDVPTLGLLRQHLYPNGVNVEWVREVSPGRIEIRVFERGVGETLACGTGSVATAYAARLRGMAGDEVTVVNPGGELSVYFEAEVAWLSGRSALVAEIDPAVRLVPA